MQMSRQMAGAIPETDRMSSFTSPEVSVLFEDWLGIVEGEILEALRETAKPSEIAAKLRISEKTVTVSIDKMKREGKLKTP
ncbi:MAG: winged helix-turn-helix domain-containing protein [Deltaproteobacteria bacterium]|nr:MAG: winged helix-turn-helix domain-containing protein [Deltaproteobacteria bacterium]